MHLQLNPVQFDPSHVSWKVEGKNPDWQLTERIYPTREVLQKHWLPG